MTRRDKWKQRPVVMRYRAFCDELRLLMRDFPLSDAISLQFVMPMPKRSWTVAKRADMDGQPHQQKPDVDNLVKSVLDALLVDDSRVHTVHATKTWGEAGSITITNLEEA